jgi:uncharacterized protein with GYD domain
MINTKEKESRRLRTLKKEFERLGCYVILSRASLGPFDLVVLDKSGVRLIQVKCNSWPDAAEDETIRAFNQCPVNTSRAVYRYDDGKRNPWIKFY